MDSVPDCEATSLAVPSATRRWLTLSITSLLLAGLLSLFVVVGRIPALAGVISDPLMFRRALVVHVTLALTVWFYSFIAGLAHLAAPRLPEISVRWMHTLAGISVVFLLLGAIAPGGEPILANYLPVVDHPIFLLGLILFFASVFALSIMVLVSPIYGEASTLPPDALVAMRATLWALLLAGVTWLATQFWLPEGLSTLAWFEFSAWGAGHVLQVANVGVMLTVWLWAVARLSGRPLLSVRWARVLMAALVLPHLLVPLFAVVPAWQGAYIHGSTQLMRFAIFPVVLVVMAASAHRLISSRARRLSMGPAERLIMAGVAGSMGLTLLGFILGAMIRGSTALVPAHYHAALGGVTLALMTMAYFLIQRKGEGSSPAARDARGWIWPRLQIHLYSWGQAVFAIGFGLGGWFGLGRKEYGGDQPERGLGEVVGLGVMGMGGLLAAIGGILFLILLIRRMKISSNPELS